MLAALPWLRWRRICGGDFRIACPEPELPEPRRKSRARAAGALAPRPALSYTTGSVSEWGQPWFVVASSEGSRESMRGHALAPRCSYFSPFRLSSTRPSSASTLASSTRCGCRAGSRGCAPRHLWRAHADKWLEPLAQEERDEGSRRDGVLLGEGARAAERTPRARESLRPRTLSEPAPPCTPGSLLARQSQAPATASLWGDVTDTPIG